jgi:signal peptidase II
LKRLPVVPLLAIATLALDQFTKWLVTSNLAVDQSIDPIPALSGLLAITHVTNTGVAFGLFKEAGTFFIFVAAIVITVIVLYLRNLPKDQGLVRVALGLQLGGAFGNLLDRLRLGYVVDFIDFKFWPVFNVADSAIVIGVTLLAIGMWRENRSTSARPQESDPSPGGEQLPG